MLSIEREKLPYRETAAICNIKNVIIKYKIIYFLFLIICLFSSVNFLIS